MSFSVADIVFLILLIAGALRGMSRGLIREIISLVGFVGALIVANLYYHGLAQGITGSLGGALTVLRQPMVSEVIAFVIILLIVALLAHLVGEVLHKIVGLAFLGLLDSVGGLLFGFVEAAVLILVLLLAVSVISPVTFQTIATQSGIAVALLPYGPLLFRGVDNFVFPGPDLLPRPF